MTTIIERGSHSGDTDSSATTVIVAVLAIVLLMGFALFMFRVFPFGNVPANTDGGSINVNVDGQVPDAMGGVQ